MCASLQGVEASKGAAGEGWLYADCMLYIQ